MSDPETIKVYATQADKYAAITDDDKANDAILSSFMATLPAAGRVLDLGCGPGTSSGILAKAGFQVTATDAVPEMIALASKHAGVDAYCATFEDIEGTDIYDGIWANFSLLHAAKVDMPRHLAALVKVPGEIHTSVHFDKKAQPDDARRTEQQGREQNLDTGAFLIGCWQKSI